jgi:hypothetical protein
VRASFANQSSTTTRWSPVGTAELLRTIRKRPPAPTAEREVGTRLAEVLVGGEVAPGATLRVDLEAEDGAAAGLRVEVAPAALLTPASA